MKRSVLSMTGPRRARATSAFRSSYRNGGAPGPALIVTGLATPESRLPRSARLILAVTGFLMIAAFVAVLVAFGAAGTRLESYGGSLPQPSTGP